MFVLTRLTGFHAWLNRRQFWGYVTFRYQNGEVTHVKCEQEYKLDTLPMDSAVQQEAAARIRARSAMDP